ncbi:CIC11C00000000916 [Sungouiella intermedia]|uniref:CIC11C00000000916 n=1 Tax=Sungouiella intermedia TaxID=45354 RepID=A0A1L0BE46_9ASCO|nr:CIC11C00000000916 [[Candida] intermedia]
MTTVLITGANRGIGLELLKLYAADPQNKVIATARNAESGKTIESLAQNNIHVLLLDMNDSLEQIQASFEPLAEIAPEGIDVVIQNAGASIDFPVPGTNPANVGIDGYAKNFGNNTLGPIKIYQALYPYWTKKTGNIKKFIFVSSVMGLINNYLGSISFGYGMSKAALNHFVKEVSTYNSKSDDETLKTSLVLAVHPGLVKTDMARDLIEKFNLTNYLTPDESAGHLKKLFDGLKDGDNGTFKKFDGQQILW